MNTLYYGDNLKILQEYRPTPGRSPDQNAVSLWHLQTGSEGRKRVAGCSEKTAVDV